MEDIRKRLIKELTQQLACSDCGFSGMIYASDYSSSDRCFMCAGRGFNLGALIEILADLQLKATADERPDEV